MAPSVSSVRAGATAPWRRALALAVVAWHGGVGRSLLRSSRGLAGGAATCTLDRASTVPAVVLPIFFHSALLSHGAALRCRHAAVGGTWTRARILLSELSAPRRHLIAPTGGAWREIASSLMIA